MTELDDAMAEHMAYIVFQEHRPFSYRDFLHFEVDEREYKMRHGTFRNKVSSLVKKGEVELSYVSGPAFYTLKNVPFGMPKLMTGTHAGVRYSSRGHPIARLIQDLPVERKALHDIHLRFESKRLWSLLFASSLYKPNSYSKDICLLPLKAGGSMTIRTTVHSTDTVSVVVGCSLAPIAVDISGIIRLSNALTRVEERLSRVIEACYSNHRSDISGVAPAAGARGGKEAAALAGNRPVTLPPIPEHKDWIVTMWHFGMDASVEYTGERFSATWEIGENALVRAYSKEMVNVQESASSRQRKKNIIRIESQEYPSKTMQDAIQEKLGAILL
jgi:hypothetical protein